jgi:rhodanese-related sulfurtransferase
MSQATITPEMTMETILQVVPAAQRALFQRYHVGGCSACGFQPTDTLAQVCKDHNLLDVEEVIRTIQRADEVDRRCQVEAGTVKAWLDAGQDLTFLDVRPAEERELARIPQTEPLDFADSARYLELPKDRRIVFACKDGQRALDVASYFIGHGFTNVWSLRGGLLAWSAEVDAAVGTY